MSRLFPELEGQTAPAPPPPPAAAPAPPPAVPTGGGGPAARRETNLVGGRWSLQKFDQLLGLPGPFTNGGECHVVSARVFADDHLEMELLGGGIPRTNVWFLKPEEKQVYARAPHFGLAYKGKDGGPVLHAILERTARRLEKATLQNLRKVILMDPEKRLESGTGGGGGAEGGESEGPNSDMLRSLVQAYGSSVAWCNFFADKEQQRNFCHNLSGSILAIGHEDLECHYATPETADGTVSFFNYPPVHERHLAVTEDERRNPLQMMEDPHYMISDLGDLDIIKGGAKKLDRALDSILDFKKKPEMVLVRATCVPIVIGDDMEGSVDRFRKKSGLEVIYLDNIADEHATPFRSTFEKIKNAPEFKNPTKVPGSINLVGFPRESETAPLESFLAKLGITVNTRLLPDIDVAVMKKYMQAEAAVLFDTVLYDGSYKELLGDVDLKSIRPTAPIGLRHTQNWLRAIAEAVGRTERFDEVWAETFGDRIEAWEKLKKEAAGYRLGFVVDAVRAKLLREPRQLMGIPVISVLEEMGFGVDVLVRTPAAKPEDAKKILGDIGSETVQILPFSTPAELAARLKESEALAFYSEVFFDRRLTRSGKGQFSAKHFQMGVDGAFTTLQGLLSVCRMPFYRKYSGYLGKAFHA